MYKLTYALYATIVVLAVSACASGARPAATLTGKTDYRTITDAATLDRLIAELSMQGENPVLIDLRDGVDYERAHAPRFLNVPNARAGEPFATWIAPFRKDKYIILMCYGGNRSARAFEYLVVSGFTRVWDFSAGYESYAAAQGPSYVSEQGSCDCPK